MEVRGNNITVKNSRLSNGKNVLRCFSSYNIVVENSLLSNSRNFLITTGSNEYIQIDDLEKYDLIFKSPGVSFKNLDKELIPRLRILG
jgi:hypothetical protein